MFRMLRKMMFVALPAAMLAFTPLSANADHRSHGHRHGGHGHHGHIYRGGFGPGLGFGRGFGRSPFYYGGYGYRPYRNYSPYYGGSYYYGSPYYGNYGFGPRFGISTPGFGIWF